ncbi:DUF4407 domain-containing protein [Microbispora amethystogenes]|uniref:DUF4407 domain-containing protein n=1 Tax=Microbispora amethystogenes TaxID=1427754 RepID=UPI001953BFE2|nr:DUF4407 domain-containing protein [Microbispora amethystogenes]
MRGRAGRFLRWLAGVDERLIREVGQERARYTSLGGIVASTALVAGASLLGAATLVTGVFWLFLLPFALAWSCAVANLDRFLISGMHGKERARRRSLSAVARIFVAVVLGLIIAEPLTLTIFQTRLDQEIRSARLREVTVLESRLTRCNPLPGENQNVTAPDCAEYVLSGGQASVATGANLTELKDQVKQARDGLARDRRELRDRQNAARKECNGTSGEGLTGRFGVGPSCRKLRAEADKFASDSRIDQRQKTLLGLETQLNALAGEKNKNEAEESRLISKKIADTVRQKKESYQRIDLLERWEALGTLSSQSGFVTFVHWLLRIFFVLFDCLPVISKLINGSTSYDELIDRKRRSDLDRAEAKRQAEDRKVVGEYEHQLHEENRRFQRKRQQVDLETRLETLHQTEEVDKLAARIRRGTSSDGSRDQ